ncbi:hypothetical protein QYF36_022625 [Acer negundo]|nr:hypothetical protein QYF36_022625 [Acer negundo]
MSNIFWKNLHLCFSSSLRCPNNTNLNPSSPPSLSKQDHHGHHQNHSSSSSSSSPPPPPPPNNDPTSILIKNFKTLYDLSSSSSFSTSKDDLFLSSTSSSSDTTDTSDTLSPPDFATIFASQRFFFSSPGRSNSIIESSPEHSTSRPIEIESNNDQEAAETASLLDGGVAVKKYSPDPYKDFRCSMQEMIEAKNLKDVISNWDFLHELLFCYLSLNPKHTHKFIITAFSDILISLLSSPDSTHNGHRR